MGRLWASPELVEEENVVTSGLSKLRQVKVKVPWATPPLTLQAPL